MKFFNFLKILLVFTLINCQKEDLKSPALNPVEDTSQHEKEMRAFCQFESRIEIGITAHGLCCYEGISQLYRFRFEPYSFVGDKFFYKIKKRIEHKYYNGPQVFDWTDSEGLYRYDFANKKSYYYSDTNDTSPELVMDFLLDSGDVFPIEPIMFDLHFNVTSRDTFMVDGIIFPMLHGFISTNAEQDAKLHITLTPYYPNPIFMEYSLMDFGTNTNWHYTNFSGSCTHHYHVDKFWFSCWNVVDSSESSFTYFTDCNYF